ncbi:hypothetical protein AJ80_00400 [Polytolypa hystricis UAMH7299]|uniref:ferric-chelate reductase (NADPH) n=1 Tax=Polytolypa hystricis (strain UAMH7299) TaxID=1447883 RepID=A0A2B7Z366_POLH7|nr:hypothetical protein AJ80_00400 [Polytolypa hystricis UAMH7299]
MEPSLTIFRRHIQDHDAAESVKPHWGYASRVVPCVNDPGSCEYLDAVYWMHDVTMLYTFIMWAVIGGILLIIVAFRVLTPRRPSVSKPELEGQVNKGQSTYARAWSTVSAFFRRWLLPESFVSFFGHVTRLQVVLLAGILAYLLIFSLVGIVYKTWVTPVKDSTLYNTRVGMAGFANRVGALAYALTPLTVALSTRENLLSLITGIPYQHFNFLHRWTGRIIFVQSCLHTLVWTIIEGKLYQPQPKVYVEWIVQVYMVFGIIAQILISFLYVFSIKRVVNWTGHEFFRKSHYIAGILYLGACWGHWDKLACWMIASIGVLFLDRGFRLLRTLIIHFKIKDAENGVGFRAAQSSIVSFDDGDNGTVVRLDFSHRHAAWKPGQHFFLCFPELSVWQSHPFTPVSLPMKNSAEQRHAYIVRCLNGETARLSELAARTSQTTTPVILTGPFGGGVLDPSARNILAIAGGTGISFALPLALAAVRDLDHPGRLVELVWIIKRACNIRWIEEELDELLLATEVSTSNTTTTTTTTTTAPTSSVSIRIFITRESTDSDSATKDVENISPTDEKLPTTTTMTSIDSLSKRENVHITYLTDHHPSTSEIVQGFIGERAAASGGKTQVVASGPPELGHDLRASVAEANDAGKAWRGEGGGDVGLYWDNRFF